jgi:DNA recombination protein RmuC
MRDAFSALSTEALRQNTDSFGQVVAPVQETLDKLSEHLRATDRNQSGLSGQLKSVTETQELLRRQTHALVSALKSPNQRGLWGEVQLRNVLERAGMLPYCDFIEKDQASTDDGRRVIPDVRVLLPNNACVVIDSKVPIDAYLRWNEAESAQRDALLTDHTRQVRDHIKCLGAKNYWARFQRAPEFVVMFMPAESLFHAALQADASLFDYAIAQKVIPASPLTLVALLRTVESAWQQQRLAESAEQVRALGAELYDRLATMAEAIQSVGQNIRQAGNAFDRFLGSLDTRVMVTARKFKELGVTPTKEMPEPESARVEIRESRAPELRAPVQAPLIDAELEIGTEKV